MEIAGEAECSPWHDPRGELKSFRGHIIDSIYISSRLHLWVAWFFISLIDVPVLVFAPFDPSLLCLIRTSTFNGLLINVRPTTPGSPTFGGTASEVDRQPCSAIRVGSEYYRPRRYIHVGRRADVIQTLLQLRKIDRSSVWVFDGRQEERNPCIVRQSISRCRTVCWSPPR